MQDEQLQKDSEQTTLFDYPDFHPVAAYLLHQQQKMTNFATPLETLLEQLTFKTTAPSHPQSLSRPHQPNSEGQEEQEAKEEEPGWYRRRSVRHDSSGSIGESTSRGEGSAPRKRRMIGKNARRKQTVSNK